MSLNEAFDDFIEPRDFTFWIIHIWQEFVNEGLGLVQNSLRIDDDYPVFCNRRTLFSRRLQNTILNKYADSRTQFWTNKLFPEHNFEQICCFQRRKPVSQDTYINDPGLDLRRWYKRFESQKQGENQDPGLTPQLLLQKNSQKVRNPTPAPRETSHKHKQTHYETHSCHLLHCSALQWCLCF